MYNKQIKRTVQFQ